MMHTLIIGAQGVGKTALIREVIRLTGVTVAGFETVKEDSLADELHGSPVYIYRAGKPHERTPDQLVGYSKHQRAQAFPSAFDRAAGFLSDDELTGDMILLDEIGIMESSSPAFCSAILRLLDGDKPVIAAVKQKDTPFLTAVKSHPNCRCFCITEENREDLLPEVMRFVAAQLKKR